MVYQHSVFILTLLIHINVIVVALLPAPIASPAKSQSKSTDSVIASETAYDLFSLYLAPHAEESWKEGKVEKELVFKNGDVQDHWLPTPSIVDVEEPNVDHLFRHDEYSDRISFEFFFGTFPKYDISKPTCTVSDSSIANPKVIEFQIDSEERSGSFSIVYDCHRHPTSSELKNVTVSVIVPVVTGLSVLFSFRKTCGGGEHNFLEFGYYEESQNAASEVSRVSFSRAKNTHRVGPHVVSTKLFLHLHHPAGSQEFFHITTNTSSNDLTISTRGPTFGGVLRPPESAIIHILYDCRGKGEVEVSIAIPIYPFHALTASWIKDCGGGIAEGLNVGSSAQQLNDIVHAGVSTDRWALALQTSSERIDSEAPVINSSIRWKDIWLANDGIPVHLAPPIITLEKPYMLNVIFLPTFKSRRNLFSPQQGGLMPTGANLRLRLQFICTRKGRSLVIVTFPIKSFSNVDFGLVKECRAPHRYVHSGFLRTANSVMVTVSLFISAIAVVWWKMQFRQEKGVPVEKPVSAHMGACR